MLPGTFGYKLSRLFTEGYNSGTPADTTVESVGFQLAVWELQYETVAGPYNLSNGTFTGLAAAATIAEANALLAGLGAFAPEYQITQLTSTVPTQWVKHTRRISSLRPNLRQLPSPNLQHLRFSAWAWLDLPSRAAVNRVNRTWYLRDQVETDLRDNGGLGGRGVAQATRFGLRLQNLRR